MANRILTIIVTYNGMKWIESCLASLGASSIPSDMFIIDNGSSDGTLDYLLSRKDENIHIHISKDNLGFGKANNIGLEYALENGYDFVYLLNQDAWIFPETYQRLIEAFENENGIGIASPIQKKADLKGNDTQFDKQCKKYLEASDKLVLDVPFVMAAHWMISRECLEKTGGFSPAFQHYGEDGNYIDRAKYNGFRCCIVKDAIAVHDRDSRPRPKSYRMRLKRIEAIRKLSDPNTSFAIALFKAPLWLFAMGVYHLSIPTMVEAFKLLGKASSINKIRKQSFDTTAFLKTTSK